MDAQRKFQNLSMAVDEFLTWSGDGHQGKLELVEGRVRAQDPASVTHGYIQANIVIAVGNHLRAIGGPCRVATEPPVVPALRSKRNARAPDVAVTCSPPSDSKVMQSPVLIVEVLSPSNEDETWESISALASLTSLTEIMVVQSTSVEVQVFTRDAAGGWPQEPVVATAGGTVHLASVALDLPVIEIYRGTHLEAAGS
jgi:Uma2 family endonuclease